MNGIYERIDALSGARSQAELVAELQEILRTLAYGAVVGDDAALTHERWHDSYERALRSGAKKDGEKKPPPAQPRRESRPAAARPTTAGRPTRPAARPDEDLPDSLRKIMHDSRRSSSDS